MLRNRADRHFQRATHDVHAYLLFSVGHLDVLEPALGTQLGYTAARHDAARRSPTLLTDTVKSTPRNGTADVIPTSAT